VGAAIPAAYVASRNGTDPGVEVGSWMTFIPGLPVWASPRWLEWFAMAGGYAVQVHGIVERPSEDVDLFTDQPEPDKFHNAASEAVAAWRSDGLEVSPDQQSDTFARFYISDGSQRIEAELSYDWRSEPPVVFDVGPVLSRQRRRLDRIGDGRRLRGGRRAVAVGRRAASGARTVYRGRLRLLAEATTAGWLRFRYSSSTSLGRSQLAMTVQLGRWKDHHCTACHFRSPMAGER
jgi:Nucleotidyl transferase AbiEii toxin, Type IV TA system